MSLTRFRKKKMREAKIVINGTEINYAQSMTFRVMLTEAITNLVDDKEYMESLGEIGPLYLTRLREIERLIVSST